MPGKMSRKLLAKYMNEFSGQYTALADKIILELNERLKDVTDTNEIDAIVNWVFKKHGFAGKIKKSILSSLVQVSAEGAGIARVADPVALTRWYLDRAYDTRGVSFSSKINDLTKTQKITDLIKSSLRNSIQWKQASQNLSDLGIQGADVSTRITDLLEIARKASNISNDPALYKEYRTALQSAKRHIKTLIDPGTNKLKWAYKDVIKLGLDASEKAVEKATHYAIYFKQRYNAERFINTEFSRAYSQGFNAQALTNEDVIGVKWVLSSGHEVYDVCNYYAEADLFGMGKGIYPKDKRPNLPAHPHCSCQLEEVYRGEVKQGTFDPSKGNKVINKLSEENKQALLGKEGLEAFKGGASWENLMKNYGGISNQYPTIPPDYLYGKYRAK